MTVSVNIMLGTACNWKCPYCLQESGKGFNKKPDIEKFCYQFNNYIKNNNLNIKRLAYWGGEPCFYWNYVNAIEDLVVKNNTNIKYPSRFITNGSLLTDNQINFLNDRNILVNVSYHLGDLSEDQWKKVLRIKNLYVTSLVHHKNLSWDIYHQKWKYIWDTYRRCISWFVYPIHYTPGVPEDWILTISDIDKYIEYLYSIIDLAYEDPFYNKMLDILFYDFHFHDYDKSYSNFCYNKDVLSIDLFGNKYFCHHDCKNSNIVGNIFNKSLYKIYPVNNESKFLKNLRSQRSQCQNCKIYKYCIGGCFRDLQPEVSCYFKLKMYDLLQYIKDNHNTIIDENFLNLID